MIKKAIKIYSTEKSKEATVFEKRELFVCKKSVVQFWPETH